MVQRTILQIESEISVQCGNCNNDEKLGYWAFLSAVVGGTDWTFKSWGLTPSAAIYAVRNQFNGSDRVRETIDKAFPPPISKDWL